MISFQIKIDLEKLHPIDQLRLTTTTTTATANNSLPKPLRYLTFVHQIPPPYQSGAKGPRKAKTKLTSTMTIRRKDKSTHEERRKEGRKEIIKSKQITL